MHLRRAQRTEDDHVVDTVEKLRAEVLAHHAHNGLLSFLEVVLALEQVRKEQVRSQVRSHDEHGVFEVDGAAFRVGQAAVIHHLQKHVEDVGVRLFDLVEEDDRVAGLRRTASVSWPPSS